MRCFFGGERFAGFFDCAGEIFILQAVEYGQTHFAGLDGFLEGFRFLWQFLGDLIGQIQEQIAAADIEVVLDDEFLELGFGGADFAVVETGAARNLRRSRRLFLFFR